MAQKIVAKTKNKFLAFRKLCLSFRKDDWELCDYPVVISEEEIDSMFKSSRLQQFQFTASIVNWHLTGLGNSEKEAHENLLDSFKSVKENKLLKGEALPRPGTNAPIQFASQEKIRTHSELADDFIHRVLEIEWALLTDESSLWDFHGDETNKVLIAKIKEIYGIDISDIESANLSEILERISKA